MNTHNDFGLIGLAVMGQNLVLNVESRGYSVSVFNRTTAVTDEFVAAHPGKRLVGAKTLRRIRGQPVASAQGHDHGQGRRAGGRGHRATAPAARTRRHHHRRRQHPLHRHRTPRRAARRRWACASSAPASPAARKARARARPSCPAGRRPTWEVLQPDLREHRRQRGRRALRHPHRPRRRRPLREDDPQRHRIRRHAAHLRGLCTASRPPGFRTDEMADVFDALERRRPGELPDPDHRRRSAPARPGDRQAGRRPDPRQGRPEGHRPVDADQRRRERGGRQHHQRRGRSPHAVVDEGRARRRQHAAARARRRPSPATARRSSRKCTTRCTPPRSSATPRASTSCAP